MLKNKAILFDLGAVLLNLDTRATLNALIDLGLKPNALTLESPLFTGFECGHYSEAEFRTQLKTYLHESTSDTQLDAAWNVMMLDVPEPRLALAETLAQEHRIFLLSNTNAIHFPQFRANLQQAGLLERWDALFEQQFLSYEMGLRKPDTTIYEVALKTMNVAPNDCLFIDDNAHNIAAAQTTGIRTILAESPFDETMLKQIRSMGF